MAQTDKQTHDRRGQHRAEVEHPTEVLDANSGSLIGQLVNLSHEGLMLVSARPIPAGVVLQLSIPLSQGEAGGQRIVVGAESLWSQDANDSGSFWTGFHIIDISANDQQLLDALVLA